MKRKSFKNVRYVWTEKMEKICNGDKTRLAGKPATVQGKPLTHCLLADRWEKQGWIKEVNENEAE